MKQDEVTPLEATFASEPDIATGIAPGEIIIGTLVSIDKQGAPQVDFAGNTTEQPLVAMATLSLTQTHIGRQVALLFADGDFHRPVIIGVIHSPLQDMLENFDQSQVLEAKQTAVDKVELETDIAAEDVLIDGKKITFEAREQIVLKCGESSITLTKAGKILIRGNYLLNRSTGVNRIMGGSVQVN